MPNRRQAIIWTNADPIHWHIYAALGGDELNSTTGVNFKSKLSVNFPCFQANATNSVLVIVNFPCFALCKYVMEYRIILYITRPITYDKRRHATLLNTSSINRDDKHLSQSFYRVSFAADCLWEHMITYLRYQCLTNTFSFLQPDSTSQPGPVWHHHLRPRRSAQFLLVTRSHNILPLQSSHIAEIQLYTKHFQVRW